MLATAIGLCALAVALISPAPYLLSRSRWVEREPRAALVLWQALGLASGLALVGGVLTIALAPLGGSLLGALAVWAATVRGGDLAGGLDVGHTLLAVLALMFLSWLLGSTCRSAWHMWRARSRHRDLVDLVGQQVDMGQESVGAQDSSYMDRVGVAQGVAAHRADHVVHVLECPEVAAYCLPGHRSRVVITSGAVQLLEPDQLAAVVAHERAHLRERHDLVVLPFIAWSAALPMAAGTRLARSAVAHLVELVADDRACEGRERHVLATALARCGAAAGKIVPDGALAAGRHGVLARVRRLLSPPERAPMARALAYAAALAIIAAPGFVSAGMSQLL